MRFYQMVDNVDIPERWHLSGLLDSNGNELDARDTTRCQHIDGPPWRISHLFDDRIIEAKPPLNIVIAKGGFVMDVTFASFEMPVLRGALGALLQENLRVGVQLLPVTIGSYHEVFQIANILDCISCIDATRSEMLR